MQDDEDKRVPSLPAWALTGPRRGQKRDGVVTGGDSAPLEGRIVLQGERGALGGPGVTSAPPAAVVKLTGWFLSSAPRLNK